MSEVILHEIYTINPETGEGGWDIKYVLSRPEHIKSFPNFDVVISRGYHGFSPETVINWIFGPKVSI